jgi:thiamine pyrophosphate-dependent acetolactate synthase large subunit-like protein
LGHTRAGLQELNREIDELQNASHLKQASSRAERWSANHSVARESLKQRIAEQSTNRPMSNLSLMGALARVLPADVAVVEEAVTTTNTTFQKLGVLKNTSGYFAHRGWALGWGLNCVWNSGPLERRPSSGAGYLCDCQ